MSAPVSSIRSLAIISSQAFSLINFRGPFIKELTRRGIKVFALAPDYNLEYCDRVRKLGAEPIEFSLSRTGMHIYYDCRDLLKLAKILRMLRPDASMGYFIKPVIYGSIAAWLAKIPSRYSMIEGLGYVFSEEAESQTIRRRVLRLGVKVMYRFALHKNKRVILLNKDDIRLLLAQNIVSLSQIVHLDGIGVALDHYKPEPPVTDPVTFILIARMIKEKGVYDFVEAARRVKKTHPRTRFLVVGGTDLNPNSLKEEELKRWVAEGLIEWPGEVKDVRYWIAQASVFVLPSWYREGLPRSSQEAMAMGRPIITTDWPGCRETIKDGVNGFMITIRDIEALSTAMQRFIESPKLIETMGIESRRIAEARFDINVINRQMLAAIGIHEWRLPE